MRIRTKVGRRIDRACAAAGIEPASAEAAGALKPLVQLQLKRVAMVVGLVAEVSNVLGSAKFPEERFGQSAIAASSITSDRHLIDVQVRAVVGITTCGTQAAAENVTKTEYINDLIARQNIAPNLPMNYQVLVKVKVNGGVPVQISYVTHHVLGQ